MTMNKQWHALHRMPKNATVKEKIQWHTSHSKNCDCRDSKAHIKKLQVVTAKPVKKFKDGAKCKVIAGTHAGKSGVVQDMHTSKTGAVTITVLPANGVRFKTLAKNVELK